jgi:hypothetical protein
VDLAAQHRRISVARLVLVDVDPDTLLLDTNKVGRAMEPRMQAIVPVHLFGQTAPVEALVPLAAHRSLDLVNAALSPKQQEVVADVLDGYTYACYPPLAAQIRVLTTHVVGQSCH